MTGMTRLGSHGEDRVLQKGVRRRSEPSIPEIVFEYNEEVDC